MARTIVTGGAGCLEQMQTTDEAQVHSQRLKFSFEQNRMKYQVSVAQVFFTLLYFFLQKKSLLMQLNTRGSIAPSISLQMTLSWAGVLVC